MDDPVKFLREMAAYYNTMSANEQEQFVRRVEGGIANIEPMLLEADGGIGKTLGYLACAMKTAQRQNLPVIIATSTTTNRDQIETEYHKIVEYAKEIGDPIADVPLLNFRSVRDYASPDRLAAVIERLENTAIPQTVLNQLYEIRDRLNGNADTLLETVMPYDITYEEVEGSGVVVQRRQIAARRGDKNLSRKLSGMWDAIKKERAGLIVTTQAMLATYPPFEKMVRNGTAALVVIDEVDRLTTTDFVTFTSILLAAPAEDIDKVLTQAEEADIDTDDVRAAFTVLQTIVADIKSISQSERNIILSHQKIGEERTTAVRAAILDLAQRFYDLAERIDDAPVTDWPDEISKRQLLFTVQDLADATEKLGEFIRPEYRNEYLANMTDLRVFLSWEEGDEFRVVAARPGGLIEWLFRDGISVPVLLTTAFLGEREQWFANKIGLPIRRLNYQRITFSQPYGNLKFVYFTKLHNAVDKKVPNPAHFDDLDRILRISPWAWEERKRVVVLTPGYEDIKQIVHRLQRRGSNAPIFAHLPGTNINEIRDKLIQSAVGGILLTVYWEGFNIVGNQESGRRGLIDFLLMSRIPFQRPNRMLEALHAHLGWSEHLVYRDVQMEAKRRIHQGFNRVIRGPDDEGVVLICDSRFPPPGVLTDRHDEISPRRAYLELVKAIPDRFRFEEHKHCVDLFDAETWEQVPCKHCVDLFETWEQVP